MPVKLLFWTALGTIVYPYLGYPLLLVCLRRLFEHPVTKRPIEPSVSLVIPAHNEAHVIAAKIDNALALDYPDDKLDILVVSDGSTDGTADAARACVARRRAEARVRVIEHPINRGKIAVVNESVRELTREIVVFTDAAAMFAPDAIRCLVRSYADPEVGAVGGVYRVSDPQTATIGFQEDFYWKYETFLKRQEASMGSVLGEMSGFGRRVRIVAGNLQQLGEVRRFLQPLRPRDLFYFISHKALRLVVPFAMLAVFGCNLLLLDQPMYLATFWLQTAFYLLAAIGAVVQLRPRILRLPYYFCMINAAAFVAVCRAISGRHGIAWS